jgi:AraC-like DNA-binding protein
MHFASQFRRATGLRPHEYLLRRRIEHAKRLLLESKHNVLDVALRCGFRTQAHFTTVFKRFVGETPYCWRKKRMSIDKQIDAFLDVSETFLRQSHASPVDAALLLSSWPQGGASRSGDGKPTTDLPRQNSIK